MKRLVYIISILLLIALTVSSCAKAPTIEISEDGYWVINGEKTDVLAKGEKGDTGEKGEKGDPGEDGADASVGNDAENPLGLAFHLKDDGTYAVSIGDALYRSEISIPATYRGRQVTEVGNFEGNRGNNALKKIVIPYGVTRIAAFAFHSCSVLGSITVPISVETVGENAFSERAIIYCEAPEKPISGWDCAIDAKRFVWGYNNVSGEGDWDYVVSGGKAHALKYRGDATDVTVPDKLGGVEVASIERAFLNNSRITSVTIPEGVTTVKRNAFSNCSSLHTVSLPDTLISLQSYAFEGCTAIKAVNLKSVATWCGVTLGNQDSLPTNFGATMYFGGEVLKNLVIPEGVTRIGQFAFAYIGTLESVIMPDSLKSIGNMAFALCPLKSVSLGIGVSDIGFLAFSGGSGACNITVDEENATYKSSNGSLYSKDGKTLLLYGNRTSSAVDSSLAGVEVIGSHAFYYCNNIESVVIPDSVRKIDRFAFADCANLKSVTVGSGVEIICTGAFQGCDAISSVYINDLASWCEIEQEFGSYWDRPISNRTTKLYLNGSPLEGELVIPNGVKFIGGEAFRYCDGITSVTIPESVTEIGDYAFADCTSLKNAVIPDSVTAIGNDAFAGCTSLENVVIPDSVTTIGSYAFGDCTSLKNVVIPDSVTAIGSYAFAFCTSLESVDLGEGLIDLESGIFSDCNNLKSVTVGRSLKSISSFGAFWGCDISDVYYTGSESEWRRISGYSELSGATMHYNHVRAV